MALLAGFDMTYQDNILPPRFTFRISPPGNISLFCSLGQSGQPLLISLMLCIMLLVVTKLLQTTNKLCGEIFGKLNFVFCFIERD